MCFESCRGNENYDDDDDVVDNETWMQMSLEPNIGTIRQELQFSQWNKREKEIRLMK